MEEEQTRSPFILGNTRGIGLESLKQDYLVPVFSRDNCETISHGEFISTISDAAQTFFQGEQFMEPTIRVSHEMKLRSITGAGKLVENLAEEDTGSYYQRLAFMIECTSVQEDINGNKLNLQIVGVRSYHETNLLGNSSQKQRFRIGIGFVNLVCMNMCLNTDGSKCDINVTNTADLYNYAIELFRRYDMKHHVQSMKSLINTEISEKQLAQVLGKMRLYSALPISKRAKLNLPEFILPEAQITNFVRDYYSDENFGVGIGNAINGWQFFNLLTNYKNNYIDTTLERTVNAFNVASGITESIEGTSDSWNWFTE